ncbi:MAG: alkaline phosphatase family protein [Bacteroidetes bacterium]|nr:MAG: alkaline phosphatase family protein [Bacteroidota bacterium]
MKLRPFLIIALLFSFFQLFSQKNMLQSGPMVGYSDMFEVMLWAQTKKEAAVKIIYYNLNAPEKNHTTNTVVTKKENAYTAHLLADEVEPGLLYNYDLYINDKKISFDYKTQFQTQKLWKWRTDAPDFSFATGSGAYINEPAYDRPGKGYGGDYQIYESIADKKPDFMLWLGDNTYLRESDWNTKTGILHRYTNTRSTKEMQKLLATTHNYAIWDDHDFGPNDSDKSFWNKNETLSGFKLFWANPSYGIADTKGAITFFNWGDCDFFLLDNRYYRDPDKLISDDKTQLGKKQKEWLKNALTYSDAKFKFIVLGGQFLTTGGAYEVFTNFGYSKERTEIIEFIYKQNIKNVIFLTGDRHHSEISVLKNRYKPTIYDITTSPFTSHHASENKDEVNSLRIKGSLINQRNFSVLSISGTNDKRILKINFYDSDGKPIYNYEITPE